MLEGRIDEKVEGKTREEDMRLDDTKEKRGYWNLKEETLDLTVWKTRSRKG